MKRLAKEKYEMALGINGEPKYIPVTVNGAPVYTENREMLMRPETKVAPNSMIEWFREEYPDADIEFVRHTAAPVVAASGVVYPPEVFECRIWLEGRHKDEPYNVNGFSRRSNDDYTEFDPLGAARTSSFISAIRFLGFTVEDVPFEYEGVEPIKKVKLRDDSVVLAPIGDGLFIEAGRTESPTGGTAGDSSIEEMVSAIKERKKKKELSKAEVKTEENSEGKEELHIEEPVPDEEPAPAPIVEEEPAIEVAEETPAPVKKRRGRPKKNPAPEKAEEPKALPEVFAASPELMEIAEKKFVCEEGATEMMKKLEGKTFAEIYSSNFGLLTTITRVAFKYEGKIPYEMIEYANMIVEKDKELNS